MGLDVRLPIGLMFSIIGVLLVGYGVVTGSDAALYERSLTVNINLWWGAVMLFFGVVMFVMGRRGSAAAQDDEVNSATNSAEGRATEQREHRLGLEKED